MEIPTPAAPAHARVGAPQPALTTADWSAIYAEYNADTSQRAQEWEAKIAAGELGYDTELTVGYSEV